MDTLTGAQDNPSQDYVLKEYTIQSLNIKSLSFMEKQEDNRLLKENKDLDKFLEGKIYNLDLEKFAIVCKLNPLEISDTEFLYATQDFSHEDFVKAAYKSYLLREPVNSEVSYWTDDITLKQKRSNCLHNLRQSSQFFEKHNNNNALIAKLNIFFNKLCSPFIKLIRKMLGIEYIVINIVGAFVSTGNEFLMGCNIDGPQQGSKVKSDSGLYISGWVLTNNFQSILLRVSLNGDTVNEAFLSLSRPDVSQAFCLVDKHNRWGYEFFFRKEQLPEKGTLEIFAIISTEIIIPIGIIKFYKF